MCECADIGHLACQVRGPNSLISKLLRLLRGHFWIVVAHHLLAFHQFRQNLERFFRIAREDIAYQPKTAMKTRNSKRIEYFAPPRARWGRLQSRCWYALCDRAPSSWQVRNQGRAA